VPRPATLSYETFLAPFASGIVILFLGGFLLSAAVAKHGLDRVIAGRLLRPLSHRPILLLMAIMGISAFFSMWMSNTATAAMMLAVVAPVIASLPRESRFQRALVLAVPFGANIGGIGTPIGTPPNAVALANLRAAGFDIGFVDWMMLAVPLEIVLLMIASGVLIWLMPPEKGLVLADMERPQKLDRRGWITAIILVTAIVLWLTASWHGMAEAVVALLAAAGLTAFRILERSDVDNIDWNILILMWGGLSLGNAMQETGLVGYIMEMPIAQVEGWLLAVFIVLLSVGLSTFMSNTATAALVVPMAMALSQVEGGQLAILTALACSFAMAMPISTPPNAIAFATGRIRAVDMLRTGLILSVVGVIILLVGYRLMMPLLLGL
jgi:solute carrier family 13 (sodium-dependent dicarboxylate transporter), member 2/3/5